MLFGRFRNIRSPFSPSVSISLPKGSVTPDTAATVFFGFYEASELRAIRHLMPRDLPMVELGGGIGVISSHVVQRLSHGPYRVVEANSRIIDVLVENLARNNTNSIPIEVTHGALDYSGQDAVKLNISYNHLNTQIDNQSDLDDEIDSAPTFTLGSLVIDWEAFSLIADIEGAEAEFILGNEPAFDRCRWLCLELHTTSFQGQLISIDDLVRGLRHKGFELVYMDGSVVTARRPTLEAPYMQ